MNIFSNFKLLFFSGKRKDKLIFKLKGEINSLNLENKNLKDKLLQLKKGYNFNFFDRDIEEEIIKHLSKAKKEVNIAVAWITSDNLINELKELKNKGVLINIIITADKDKDKKDYYIKKKTELKKSANRFKILDIQSRFNSYSKKEYVNYMHNKYCIIDNKIVVDGSYNWSNNAKYNEEHIIIVESEIVAEMYKENFTRLMNQVIYEENLIRSVG